MNTIQVIVLWYGGLAVPAVLLLKALDSGGVGYPIVAVAVVTGLLVLMCASNPRVKKRRVALAVGGPFVIWVAGSWGWPAYIDWKERAPIPREQVDVTDLEFSESYGSWKFRGPVKNKSVHVLTGVTLEFTVSQRGEVVDRASTEISITVPPKEVREFADEYLFLRKESRGRLSEDAKRKDREMKLDVRVSEDRGRRN